MLADNTLRYTLQDWIVCIGRLKDAAGACTAGVAIPVDGIKHATQTGKVMLSTQTAPVRTGSQANERLRLVIAAVLVTGSLLAISSAETIPIFTADRIGFGSGQQREIRRSITFPVFGPNDRLTFDWDILGDQDPWDRGGSMHVILPDGKQVQLGKFVTGFNGTTSHRRDVSDLASLLSGQTLTVEAHIDTWVEDAWRVNASLGVEAGSNAEPNPDWSLPIISYDGGLGWHDSGDLARAYNFVTPPNLVDVQLTYFASGHHHTQTANSDEFNQRRHRLLVDGKEVWSGVPWRTDGPDFRDVNPTSGRWDGNGDGDTTDPYPIDRWSSDFPRSGWIPGDDVDPYVIDITPYLRNPIRHQVRLLIDDVDINSYWRVSAYASGTLVPPHDPPGDFNRDGVVDAADYTVWRDERGRTGVGLTADADLSGRTNDADRQFWVNNFAATSASSAVARVPEPRTCVILFSVALISSVSLRPGAALLNNL